jgi:hypothetical protein
MVLTESNFGGISGEIVVGTFKPHNTQIQHPTLRFMHRWIAMTLFPSHDIRWIRAPKLKMLYVMVKKVKIVPMREIFHHWLDIIKNTTAITCTSFVTRIAVGVGALDEGDVNYIEVPCIIVNEYYMIQGHNLKTNAAGDLLYTFSGCTNVIRLPNPNLCLYKCQQLTFDLETTVEASRKSVSGRVTRSRARKEAASSSQQPPQEIPHPVAAPQVHHTGWSSIVDMLGFVLGIIPVRTNPHSRWQMGGIIPAGINLRNRHRHQVSRRPTPLHGQAKHCWHFLASLLRTGLGPIPSNGARNAVLASPSKDTKECQPIGLYNYRQCPQAHESIVVAFHPEVFRVLLFIFC